MCFISVIITCYNERDLIERSLESVLSQNIDGIEIILINDCSIDEITNQIFEKAKLNNRIITIKNQTNLGLAGSRNKAINIAKGEIIVLLDADDTLPSNSIEIIKKTFTEYPNNDFVFGNYQIIENDRELSIDCSVLKNNQNQLSPIQLVGNWMLLGNSPFKKSLWSKINGYSLEFNNTCQDVDFWQRVILSNSTGTYVNETLYNWYRYGNSMNCSDQQKTDIDHCNYKNVDFYFKYSKTVSIPFDILYNKKDYRQIKTRSSKLNKKSFFSILQFFPTKIIPYAFKAYNLLKQ